MEANAPNFPLYVLSDGLKSFLGYFKSDSRGFADHNCSLISSLRPASCDFVSTELRCLSNFSQLSKSSEGLNFFSGVFSGWGNVSFSHSISLLYPKPDKIKRQKNIAFSKKYIQFLYVQKSPPSYH